VPNPQRLLAIVLQLHQGENVGGSRIDATHLACEFTDEGLGSLGQSLGRSVLEDDVCRRIGRPVASTTGSDDCRINVVV
jgi:hypothetical protein